jgi:two-component system, NarL family, sensor histidine kinase DegS
VIDQAGAIAAALAEARSQVERLDTELAEITLLEQAARTEAARHEQRRLQAADRLTALQGRPDVDPAEVREATTQLVTLSGRAALMQAQVDVLGGKQKTLTRFRDSLVGLSETLAPAPDMEEDSEGREAVASGADLGRKAVAGGLDAADMPPAVARAILSAQEDLRREIARAMHDGPAQSLTNIVLQAQIVQRLMERDPQRGAEEAGTLVAMVQRTLEATKTFIFDVRPMVLDDLGLLPTLRRAARDRGRRARVPVAFDSLGVDRRLPPDLESAVFRILDEGMTGLLSTAPTRMDVQLDWSEHELRARLHAVHPSEPEPAEVAEETPQGGAAPSDRADAGPTEDIPPQLAAMIQEQQEGEAAALFAAEEAIVRRRALPASVWREIQQRAASAGIEVALAEEGRRLDVLAQVPAGT